MSPERPPHATRRGLLLAGGGGLVALGAARLLGGRESTSASMTLPVTPSPPSPDIAPTSSRSPAIELAPRFDLGGTARADLSGMELHEKHHSAQGIGYDVANRRLFVVQQRDGRPGADLCINQLTDGGRLVAHQHVDRAGHGQSFGVESVGTASYLWLESDANENTDAGRGTALARFRFVPGVTPTVHTYFAGRVEVGCAIDPVNGRLAIRRPEDGRTMYSVFDLGDAKDGFGSPLWRFEEPRSLQSGSGPTVLQAFTLLGTVLYVWVGTGGHAGTAADPFDSYLSAISVRTGEVVQQRLITAGRSLVFREPEGLAIDVVDGAPKLCFGFSSRPRPSSSRRLANIYSLSALA